jgi:hypothetical protein
MFAALVVAAALAVRIDDGMRARAEVRSCVERVLEAGGYGHLRLEGAAFITRDGDGFLCEMWPRSVTFHSTSWSGRIPANTVAIVHSHPADIPEPSVGDAALARTLGIPVLVVTPRGVTAAGPGASAVNFLRKFTY